MTFTNDTSYELVYQRDRDGDIQTIYSGESTTNNRYINESIYYQEPKGGQWYQLTLGKIDPAKDAGLWDILSWDKAQLEAAEVTYISQAQCLDSTCDLYQITRDSITLNLALDTQTFRPVKASYRHNNIDVEFIYTFPHLEINSPENPELLEFPVDPTDLDMDILNTIYGDEPDN
jgi:hypothetical protein